MPDVTVCERRKPLSGAYAIGPMLPRNARLAICHGIHQCMNKSCVFQMPAVRLLLSNITSLTKSDISPLKHWVEDLHYVSKIDI